MQLPHQNNRMQKELEKSPKVSNLQGVTLRDPAKIKASLLASNRKRQAF